MTTIFPIPPVFLNMLVIALPSNDGSGTYQVTCNPPYLTVTQPNTIISFQLIGPTPEDVIFAGFEESGALTQQMSPASIPNDGKLMMTVDANSATCTMNINLLFKDSEVPFSFDPQVHNQYN
ncbi:hypothetical protein ACVBEF_02795 [Glaciimonas sp. GG7]